MVEAILLDSTRSCRARSTSRVNTASATCSSVFPASSARRDSRRSSKSSSPRKRMPRSRSPGSRERAGRRHQSLGFGVAVRGSGPCRGPRTGTSGPGEPRNLANPANLETREPREPRNLANLTNLQPRELVLGASSTGRISARATAGLRSRSSSCKPSAVVRRRSSPRARSRPRTSNRWCSAMMPVAQPATWESRGVAVVVNRADESAARDVLSADAAD